MPTYDYECLRCGHRFEEFQEITARPRSRCPKCRGKVRRVISAGAGIVFKGSGWYATDSRRPSKGSSAGSGAAEGSGQAATDADKSAVTDAADKAKRDGSGSAGGTGSGQGRRGRGKPSGAN